MRRAIEKGAGTTTHAGGMGAVPIESGGAVHKQLEKRKRKKREGEEREGGESKKGKGKEGAHPKGGLCQERLYDLGCP